MLYIGMSFSVYMNAQQLLVVLDPAGDAAHAGRSIEDTYERSCTWQLAAEIKRILKRYESFITCFLSRAPGQILEPLEPIQLANRLQANLFIRLHCYPAHTAENYCHFYYLVRHPVTDWWHAPQVGGVQFIPLESAHQIKLGQTKKSVESMAAFLRPLTPETGFIVPPALGMPCQHLQGLLMPACIIELGVAHAGDWRSIAHPLAHMIKEALLALREDG
jgi:N-acetylmuramoyl-L-alanine amidase